MKVVEVNGVNFQSLGEVRFGLADKGLILIQGSNLDNPSSVSNGSGKSTLMDLMLWIIYGETAQGASGAEIIRHDQKKAYGAILLSDGKDEYLIERERTKSKETTKLQHFDTSASHVAAVSLTLGTEKLTQTAIIKAIGSSKEVFQAAVYLGQEQMPDLPGMTDRKLKELIEEAAGVGVIEEAYQLARDRALEAKRQCGSYISEVAYVESGLRMCRSDLDTIKVTVADWNQKNHDEILLLREHADRDRLASLKLVGGLAPHAAIKDLKVDLAKIDARLAGFSKSQADEKVLLNAEAQASRELAGIQARIKGLIEAARTSALEAEAIEAREGQPCDACGQALTADALSHACTTAKTAASARKGSAMTAGAMLPGAKAALEAASALVAAHRASMGDPSLLQAEAQTLRDALTTHESQLRVIENLNATIKRNEEQADALAKTENPYAKLVTMKEKDIADTQDLLTEANVKLDVANKESLIAQALVKVFGPAGVRAQILDNVTPFLNERTSNYLTTLSDGTLTGTWTTLVRDAKGELKEKFAIEVTHPAGEGFRTLSGGEKRKIRLACGMALQDLVASRATKPFELWVADEIDNALDTAGLERLMTVLEQKAREKGSVIVISHNSLRDWISEVWTVIKEDKVTRIET